MIEQFAECGNCCAGGFYFTDIDHIFEFLDYGIYLREITLPFDDIDFRCVADGNNKWRCNKIFLGKKYPLADISTFKYLIECGADVVTTHYAIGWAVDNDSIELLKYLIEYKIQMLGSMNEVICHNKKWDDVCHYNQYYHDKAMIKLGEYDTLKYNITIKEACRTGDFDMIRDLTGKYGYYRDNYNYLAVLALENGHINIAIFLIDNYKAKIDVTDKHLIRRITVSGHLDAVRYLVEKGADIRLGNDWLMRHATKHGHLQLVKYFISNGADIHAECNNAFSQASYRGHNDIIEYLNTLNV